MDKPERSPFYTTKEAAEYLRLETRTLDNMRWRGNGPRFRKHGSRVLYHIDDLNSWSKANGCGSTAKIEQDYG